MKWIAAILIWLGNLLSRKDQDAAIDHVSAAVESTDIKEMQDDEAIHNHLPLTRDQLLQRDLEDRADP